MNNKITPCLWFSDEAEEATNFYISLFENSRINGYERYTKAGFEYHQKPEGSIASIEFELSGQKFVALNGGPVFKFSEAISLFVYCETDERFEKLYEKLIEDGEILMEKDKYDWSEKYAWVKDKYGLSWQLDIEKINSSQKIVPSLLFVNEKFTLLKEAFDFYVSIFPESKQLYSFSYPPSEDIPEGTLLFNQVSLSGYILNSMSSSYKHNFDFNEAISLMIMCDSQEEIDYFWEKLLDGGMAQQCGWLKDKFGISWQVVSVDLLKISLDADMDKLEKIQNALFKMIKIDWNELKQIALNK